jgi:hypothetical protein
MISGCATVPDTSVNYFLPKAQTTVQVTESLACNSEGNKIFYIDTVTPTTVYAADPTRHYSFSMKSVSHWYADTSLTIKLTTDGRLQSINGQTTGAGEGLVKAVVGALEMAAVVAAGATHSGPASVEDACKIINKAGSGKAISLTYYLANAIDYSNFGQQDLPFKPDAQSASLHGQLSGYIPVLTLSIGNAPSAATRTVMYTPAAGDDVIPLRVVDTGNVELTVTATVPAVPGAPAQLATVFDQNILVPLPTDYILPITRGAFFGTRNTELDFDSSGAITTITYNKSGGSTDVANAVTDTATPFSPAQTAANLKDQADVIAQQQRLLNCRKDASTCSD